MSLQNETLNREFSSPIVTSNAATVDHTQSTILQGSEKENIQPASEVPLGENVNDGNPENLRIDTSEDSRVIMNNYLYCVFRSSRLGDRNYTSLR